MYKHSLPIHFFHSFVHSSVQQILFSAFCVAGWLLGAENKVVGPEDMFIRPRAWAPGILYKKNSDILQKSHSTPFYGGKTSPVEVPSQTLAVSVFSTDPRGPSPSSGPLWSSQHCDGEARGRCAVLWCSFWFWWPCATWEMWERKGPLKLCCKILESVGEKQNSVTDRIRDWAAGWLGWGLFTL